jgi:hypothetical protein
VLLLVLLPELLLHDHDHGLNVLTLATDHVLQGFAVLAQECDLRTTTENVSTGRESSTLYSRERGQGC